MRVAHRTPQFGFLKSAKIDIQKGNWDEDVSYLCNDRDQLTLSKGMGVTPPETPVMIVPGTSDDGRDLRPYVQYLISKGLIVYDAYIPEIRYSTGLHRINPDVAIPESGQPSYVMLLRDMGDFRIQMFAQRMEKLQAQLNNAEGEQARHRVITQFFRFPAEWPQGFKRKVADRIDKALIRPMFALPPVLRQDFALDRNLVDFTGLLKRRLCQEASKVYSGEWPPMISTRFLSYQVELANEGRQEDQQIRLNSNYAVRHPGDPTVVDLRPISLQDVARFEAYVLFLQDNLKRELLPILKRHYLWRGQDGMAISHVKQAQESIEHLMEPLFPSFIAMGHSQGGFALVDVLLHSLKEAPDDYAKAKRKAPLETCVTGERSRLPNADDVPIALLERACHVGVVAGHAAPLKGVTPGQPWLEKGLKPMLRLLPKKLREKIFRDGWERYARDKQSILEMKKGSAVVAWIQENLPLLWCKKEKMSEDLTVVSVHDPRDHLTLQEANHIHDINGKTPYKNVFNFSVELPLLPERSREEVMAFLTKLLSEEMGYPVDFSKLPMVTQGVIYKKIGLPLMAYFETHRTVVERPDIVDRTLPVFYLQYPGNFVDLLEPGNFHPLQARMLTLFSVLVENGLSGRPGLLTLNEWTLYKRLERTLQVGYESLTKAMVRLYFSTSDMDADLHQAIVRALNAMMSFAERAIRTRDLPKERFSTLEDGYQDLVDNYIVGEDRIERNTLRNSIRRKTVRA